jgi:hypothetical protein
MLKTVERTSISLSPELFAAAQRYASNEGRTFSGLIATLIRDHLAAHNALPKSDDARKQAALAAMSELYSDDEISALVKARTTPEAAVAAQ